MPEGRLPSEKQLLAISVLERGGTCQAAAEVAGVTRQTVSRWMHHDVVFQAERNRRKAELLDRSHMRILNCLDEAVADLVGDLAGASFRDVVRLLEVLLKSMDWMSAKVGQTDESAIVNQHARRLFLDSIDTTSLPDWAIFAIEDVSESDHSDSDETARLIGYHIDQ